MKKIGEPYLLSHRICMQVMVVILFVFTSGGINLFGKSDSSELRFSNYFSSDMILQRNEPITLYGFSFPKDKVVLEVLGSKSKATCDPHGYWSVTLPTQDHRDPFNVLLYNKSDTVELERVLLGDVWLMAGQSNVLMTVAENESYVIDPSMAENKNVRLFNVPNDFSPELQKDLSDGGWLIPCEDNIGFLSALPYYFACNYSEHFNIPTAVVVCAWGGSMIENWIPDYKVNNDLYSSKLTRTAHNYFSYRYNRGNILRDFADCKTRLPYCYNNDINDNVSYHWKKIDCPNNLEIVPGRIKGRSVFRTSFLSNGDSDIELFLGYKFGGLVKVWINNQLLSEVDTDSNYLNFSVSNKVLNDTNEIIIRVDSFSEYKGLYGRQEDFYVSFNNGKFFLRDWEVRMDFILDDAHSVLPPSFGSCLFNAMVHPITAVDTKGIIWYQGESHVSDEKSAFEYRDKLNNLISGWRKYWEDNDLPFYIIQLPKYGASQVYSNTPSKWALLRESQSVVAHEMKSTHLISTMDYDDDVSLHPKNKKEISKALLEVITGKISSVTFDPSAIEVSNDDNKLRLSFNTNGITNQGPHDPYLSGFSVAGQNNLYHWAKAKMVSKNQIVVWSDVVPSPCKIRYGWSDNPDDLDLFISANDKLPSFRLELCPEDDLSYSNWEIIDSVLFISVDSDSPLSVANKYGYIDGLEIKSQKMKDPVKITGNLKSKKIELDISNYSLPLVVSYNKEMGNVSSTAGQELDDFVIHVH